MTPFPLLISSHPPEAVSARDESFHLLLWMVETGFSEPNALCAGFKRASDGNSKHPILHFPVGWKDNYGAISGPICPGAVHSCTTASVLVFAFYSISKQYVT